MNFQRFDQVKKGQNLYSKNFVLKDTILYVYYVKIYLCGVKKIDFLFYDFSMIYYDFSKMMKVDCLVLKLRRKNEVL